MILFCCTHCSRYSHTIGRVYVCQVCGKPVTRTRLYNREWHLEGCVSYWLLISTTAFEVKLYHRCVAMFRLTMRVLFQKVDTHTHTHVPPNASANWHFLGEISLERLVSPN